MDTLDQPTARALFTPWLAAIAAAEADPEVDGVIDLTCLCSGAMRLHDGDLELDDLTLRPGDPTLFVRGHLRVRGLLHQAHRAGFLIVLGDVSAGDVATTAMLFVAGDLHVRGTLFGSSSNYLTIVLGHTRAATLVSVKEHCFCLHGGRTIAQVVDVQGDTPNLADRSHGSADLIAGIDEGFDEAAVVAILRRGGSLLRG